MIIDLILEIYGYFGMFVGAILAASVAAFIGLGLYRIAATFIPMLIGSERVMFWVWIALAFSVGCLVGGVFISIKETPV